METQLSDGEEDTQELFCLLQENDMDQFGEETVDSSRVSKSMPVLPPSDPSTSSTSAQQPILDVQQMDVNTNILATQQIQKKEPKLPMSTSPQPRSQPQLPLKGNRELKE